MFTEAESKISKKQQQLVETAEDLFFRYGIKRVSIEEICQKANVSKMTFYRRFSNKVELVKYIWNGWMDEAYQKLESVEAMEIPFTEKLSIMLNYKLEWTAKMSDEVIEEFLHLPFYESARKAWIQRVMQFLAKAQQQGDIRPEIRLEFILIVLEHLQKLVDHERLKSLYPDYIEFTKEFWNFFYYGILTRRNEDEGNIP